jgi:hypothetical protein
MKRMVRALAMIAIVGYVGTLALLGSVHDNPRFDAVALLRVQRSRSPAGGRKLGTVRRNSDSVRGESCWQWLGIEQPLGADGGLLIESLGVKEIAGYERGVATLAVDLVIHLAHFLVVDFSAQVQ